MYLVDISLITSGVRSFSHTHLGRNYDMVIDKVLSDDRTHAYATTINEINDHWLDCKECNWYKSKQTILSEVISSI